MADMNHFLSSNKFYNLGWVIVTSSAKKWLKIFEENIWLESLYHKRRCDDNLILYSEILQLIVINKIVCN